MVHTPSINAFISDEERRIKGLAYYGEFFANLDFDDGFRSIVLKQLLDYLSGLETSSISCEQEETADMIRVIIESEFIGEDIVSDISEITMRLQRDFCMTPLLQSYPFEIETYEDPLPIEVEMKPKDGVRFHRQVIQNAQADVLRLEKKLKKLQFSVNALGESDDIALSAILENWKSLISQIEIRLENLKIDFQSLVAHKYIELAHIEDENKSEKVLSMSSFQADAYLDGINGENKDTENRLLSLLDRIEASIDDDKNDLRGQIQDLTKKLINVTESISEKTEVEVKIQTGLLSNIETSETKFKSATILGTETEIYHDGQKIVGFKLDGVSKLLDITDRKYNDIEILTDFIAVLPNDIVQYFYTNENAKYVPLKIEGKKNFSSISIGDYENELPAYGTVVGKNGKTQYFYSENGKYKFLNIENKKEFESLTVDRKNKNGIPARGQIKNNIGDISIFYLENKKYRLLRVHGVDIFTGTKNMEYTSTNKPKSGILIDTTGKQRCFWLEDGKHKTLEIEGKSEFTNLSIKNYDKNHKPLNGIHISKNNEQQYFYNENGEYKFLTIENKKDFRKINIGEYTDEKKPQCGTIHNTEGRQKYFWLEDGEYKVLKIDGVSSSARINVTGKDHKTGKPICGYINNNQYFYTQDNTYKIFELNGTTQLLDIHINEFNEKDGTPIRGKIKDENGWFKYFYEQNNTYKFLEVDGKSSFPGIEIREWDKDSNTPLLGKIEWKEGESKYFYGQNKQYQTLEIEGKDNFRSLTIMEWDKKNGIPISGTVSIGYEKSMYFYTKKQLISGKKIYTFFKKGTKKVFSSISVELSDTNGKPRKGRYWSKGKSRNI